MIKDCYSFQINSKPVKSWHGIKSTTIPECNLKMGHLIHTSSNNEFRRRKYGTISMLHKTSFRKISRDPGDISNHCIILRLCEILQWDVPSNIETVPCYCTTIYKKLRTPIHNYNIYILSLARLIFVYSVPCHCIIINIISSRCVCAL